MAYGNDEGLTAYLALTGRTLPGSTTAAIAREYGSLYVDGFEQDYRGSAVTTDASFPRDLWTVVPARVEQAAYEAGYAWAAGDWVPGSGGAQSGQVTREKVDVLEVQYAAAQDGSGWWENNRWIIPAAYTFLLPFFKRKGGFYPAALVV